jgi:hypothetical protein
MYLRIPAGTTSKLIQFPVYNSSSTTGALLSGLTYNASGMTAYYYREGAATPATAMTLVTMTVGTWTSLGFIAVDGTNMPGVYQLGVPNAALATGASSVTIYLQGATNMVPVVLVIELTAAVDYPSNMQQILGTAVSTPATAGILDVNVKNMNNVAATSITAVNANQGTTQPLNFTGTGASALVKVDVTDIATAAVATGSAQLGVNLVNIAGSAVSTTTAQLGVNAVNWAGGAIPSPNVTGTPKVDLVDISGSAVSTTTAQLGVNAVQIGAAVPGSATIGTVTNLTNAPTAGDLTATMKASVTAAVPSTASIAAALPTDTSIQSDMNTVLNTSYTDATSLNTYSLLDRIRWLCWLIRNQMQITDATGAGTLYNDSGTSVASSWSVTDNATTTTRTRVA